MKDIRQGNDISLQWTVSNLSQVSGDKVVQLINCDSKHAAKVIFSISGDIISGEYYGKDQYEKGEYRLILYVNRDFEGMVTLDKVGAFRLHGVCDWGIVKGTDEDNVQTVAVELESTLNVSTGGGGSFEQVQSDWSENDDTLPSYIKHKPANLSDFNNDLPTYRPIPETWDTAHTMAELIASINDDNSAVVGMAYLGTVHLSDLPADMVQAELIIDIVSRLGASGDKVIVFTFSSSEVSPYRWEYTSAYGALGTWRSWLVPSDIEDKIDKVEGATVGHLASFANGGGVEDSGYKIVTISSTDYDNLSTKDANTIYLVTS